jgi:hypothetical protein
MNIYVKHDDFYGYVTCHDNGNNTVAIDLPWGQRRWFEPSEYVECTAEEVIAFNTGFYNTNTPQEIFDALEKLPFTTERDSNVKELILAFRRGHAKNK